MADVVDDDTAQAVLALWKTDTVHLPALFDSPPTWGRLKPPRRMPYAQLAVELVRRQIAGAAVPGGAVPYYDTRKVTLTCRGLESAMRSAAGWLRDLFGSLTVLAYPAGSRATFHKWWPTGDVKLAQDPATKSGLDVWTATLEAEVTSIRTN